MKGKFISEINGFENCADYIIYKDGNVYSLKRKKFLKGNIDSNGYLYIDLRSCNPVICNPKIHRLVMLAFSNSTHKEQINHKDGDKKNNHINNLEWCTNRENRNHALKMGLKDEIREGIAQYSLDGNLIQIFTTAADAMEYLGKNRRNSGTIGRVIRGNRLTAYNYKWKQYNGSTTIGGGQVHSSEWKQGEPERVKI